MEEQLRMAGVAFSLAIIVLFLSWKYGYFRLSSLNKTEDSSLSFFTVSFIFILYFLIELLFVPLFGPIFLFFMRGSMPTVQEFLENLSLRHWLTALSLFVATFSAVFFSLILKKKSVQLIWNRAEHRGKILAKDIGMGVLSWAICYPLMVAVGHFTSFLYLWISSEPAQIIDQVSVKYLKTLIQQPPLLWTTSFAIAFIVPIGEELVFRGFLQSWLRQKIGTGGAIVIASIVFSFMHFSMEQHGSNWELLSSLFVLSCFLGFIYERQGTLWASIGLHATFNIMSILFILVVAFS